MRVFKLRIELENENLQTYDGLAMAIDTARLKVKRGEKAGTIRDMSGNTVGTFTIVNVVKGVKVSGKN